MGRGRLRTTALGVSLLPFGLLVYLLVARKDHVVVEAILAAAFALLALRGVGLKRAGAEVEPGEGHVRLDTEFEGPDDEDDGQAGSVT